MNCTCSLRSDTPAPELHAETCQRRAFVLEQETHEARVLAETAFRVLRGASNERVATTALHVTLTKLARSMNTTPVTLAETVLDVARALDKEAAS